MNTNSELITEEVKNAFQKAGYDASYGRVTGTGNGIQPSGSV